MYMYMYVYEKAIQSSGSVWKFWYGPHINNYDVRFEVSRKDGA